MYSHEGNIWKMAAVTALGTAELMVVAQTGIPPALAEIVDVDLADFPELPAAHTQHERRKGERSKIIATNASNHERRTRLTLRAWTTLFEALRSSCVAKAPLLAHDLYELCSLESRGIPGGYFDGPRAWRILLDRINGDGERLETDKTFYDTALDLQKANPLPNGCTSAEFQKKAFAYVQYIMPNLARKFDPDDAAEYILNLMPPELYEASQRIKFSAKMVGRFLDLKYLIRLCSAEVFKKQKGSAPKPTFIAADFFKGYDIALVAETIGMDIELSGPGSIAFAGLGNKQWCPK